MLPSCPARNDGRNLVNYKVMHEPRTWARLTPVPSSLATTTLEFFSASATPFSTCSGTCD